MVNYCKLKELLNNLQFMGQALILGNDLQLNTSLGSQQAEMINDQGQKYHTITNLLRNISTGFFF